MLNMVSWSLVLFLLVDSSVLCLESFQSMFTYTMWRHVLLRCVAEVISIFTLRCVAEDYS